MTDYEYELETFEPEWTEEEVLPSEEPEEAAPKKSSKRKNTYRALVGLNYKGKRVEPGELASDIPKESVAWLLSDGCIEKVEDE